MWRHSKVARKGHRDLALEEGVEAALDALELALDALELGLEPVRQLVAVLQGGLHTLPLICRRAGLDPVAATVLVRLAVIMRLAVIVRRAVIMSRAVIVRRAVIMRRAVIVRRAAIVRRAVDLAILPAPAALPEEVMDSRTAWVLRISIALRDLQPPELHYSRDIGVDRAPRQERPHS